MNILQQLLACKYLLLIVAITFPGANTAPGPTILVSALAAVIILLTGAFYFRRMEKTFADVV